MDGESKDDSGRLTEKTWRHTTENTNRETGVMTRKPRRSSYLSNCLFIIATLFTLSYFPTGATAQYQLCEQDNNGLYYEIPHKIDCIIAQKM